MLNIFFRVDSSSEIGSGHLMRCLNLANSLSNNKIEFICTNHEGNLTNKVIELKYKVNIITKTENTWLGNKWEDDCNETINILKKCNIKTNILLIVDHYSIDHIWETKIKPYVNKIMVIDDIHNRKHNCNILLDQNIYLNNNPYQNLIPNNCKLLLGCKYVMLNKYFLKYKYRLAIGILITVFAKFLALQVPQLIRQSVNIPLIIQERKRVNNLAYRISQAPIQPAWHGLPAVHYSLHRFGFQALHHAG